MKNRKIAIICVIIASFLLTAGIVKAAGFTTDWLRVGKQGTGGVTYFNGTIINDTTTDDADNPVTFGDNVRIDGRVWRGTTAGTEDTLPFIVNDNMEVAGNLTVDKNLSVTGNSTITGNLTVEGTYTAASFKDMIVGTVGASGIKSAAISESTWSGTVYDVCENQIRETTITVTFTPATEQTGTWTSNPVNIFRTSIICADPINFPRGTYTGNYKVLDDIILGYNIADPNDSPVTGGLMMANIRGNIVNLIDYQNLPHTYVKLIKQ